MKKPVTRKFVQDVDLPKGENGKPDFSAFGEIVELPKDNPATFAGCLALACAYWVGRAFIGYGVGSIQVRFLNYYGGTAARSAPEFGDKPHTLIQFHASSSDMADRDYIP